MNNEELVYGSALRYGLGRKTYITGVISDFLITKKLSEQCKIIMIRDIEEARKENRLGDDCDKVAWLKLLDYLKENKNEM